MKRASLIAFVLTAVVFGAHEASAQSARDTAAWVTELESPNRNTRMRAFERLDRDTSVWSRPGIQSALMRVVKAEDREMVRLLRDEHTDLGEDYGEYTSWLYQRCFEHCEPSALRSYLASGLREPELRTLLVAIIAGVYDLPRFSAEDRHVFAAAMAKCSRDPLSWMIRSEALGRMQALIVSSHTSTSDRAVLHEAVREALNDSWPDARVEAVHRLIEFRDTADVPLLRRMAASDTSHAMSHGKDQYFVRNAARSALAVLSTLKK